MTAEKQEELIRELCARLPFGVKILASIPEDEKDENGEYKVNSYIRDFTGINVNTRIFSTYSKEEGKTYEGPLTSLGLRYKPFLRPVSGMTEYEMDKLFDILHIDKSGNGEDWIKINDILGIKLFISTGKWLEDIEEAIKYLRSIHIDFTDLIGDNLALPAPSGMYDK